MFGRLQHIHAYMYVYLCVHTFWSLAVQNACSIYHMSSVEGKKKVE